MKNIFDGLNRLDIAEEKMSEPEDSDFLSWNLKRKKNTREFSIKIALPSLKESLKNILHIHYEWMKKGTKKYFLLKARNIYKTYLCKSSELWTIDITTTSSKKLI